MSARAKLAPEIVQEYCTRILKQQLMSDGMKFGPPLLSKIKFLSRELRIPIQDLINFTYQLVGEMLDETFKGVDGVQ